MTDNHGTPHSPMTQDKENASNRHEEKKSVLKDSKKPCYPKTPLRKTPLRRQPFQHASPRPLTTTPPGSSKVLRQHFAQLSITPQRTKIQSGAVRIQSKKKKKIPAKPKHYSPSRIGYDGTSKTPSKQLLRSTACSRSHQVSHQEHDYLHAHDEQSVATAEYVRHERRDECCDPVALILLNDGKEDLQQLNEMDIASSPSILKVSSNLEDVLDDDEVATLVRPVPKKS